MGEDATRRATWLRAILLAAEFFYVEKTYLDLLLLLLFRVYCWLCLALTLLGCVWGLSCPYNNFCAGEGACGVLNFV